MKVETYEVTEHTTEGRDSFEIEAEAQAMVEDLGLEGQKSLMVGDGETDTKTRIPYRKMTGEEERVYGTLYPETTKVEEFAEGPIPLRVLQVVAHARPLFTKLEVWHPKGLDTDPVLVGVHTPNPDQTWRTENFLLARWGDALEAFDDLKVRAIEKKTEEWTAKAKKTASEAQAFLAGLEGRVWEYMSGDRVSTPF